MQVFIFLRYLNAARQLLKYKQVSDDLSNLGHCEVQVEQDNAHTVFARAMIAYFR